MATKGMPQRPLTTETKKRFIKYLTEGMSVSRACLELDTPRPTIYQARNYDPQFAAAWAKAQEQAPERLREMVVETAIALGCGRWEKQPMINPETLEPILDQNFEPVTTMVFSVAHVVPSVLQKLLDKLVESADQPGSISVNIQSNQPYEPPKLITDQPAQGTVKLIDNQPAKDHDDDEI